MARPIEIDLVSDTSTRPGRAMLEAMTTAPVGDEQRGEDPTVIALNERVAAMLGMEAALFLPSGTMCNQIAFVVHCRPGDEIIVADSAHVFGSEGAGASTFAGAQFRTVDAPRGIFDAAAVTAALRTPRMRRPRSRVVCVEQPTNRGGGAVWPVETLDAVCAVGHEAGLATHMDGARLLNAVVATGVSAERFCAGLDSAWIDLSKGLGCPVGGVLAGSAAFIEAAWDWKHRMGGAMRQAGVLAAAGLYALDHNVDRLAEDHANAKILAARLSALEGVAIVPPEVETNMVFIDVAATRTTAPAIAAALQEEGIRMGVESPTTLRAVTHLDVDRAGVERAADVVAAHLASRS
ncbi:low specificity L-threonine aldolase [Acuticoccus sp. I52.16.1]|uniref:threonine aldolase family protein n=1 Tax=Acuticoccus sp. I52.16.1 TaxID=2928472 RepID=UPI001FD4FA10|nr:GntG family PLP-dependent aldolase [Acuticoccus sp. I52.16.1]UOM37152.1 aminotransferase class I/II-fold pyridoxal phosphate-dependent enzyme [Acuticoccus sp. I52.16.1]